MSKGMEGGVSRRSFLKGAGVAAAAVAGSAALAGCASGSTGAASNAEIQGRPGTDPFYGAPTVVVVLADGENYNWMRDGALVMGNLMNAAWSLGVGSCWINRALELFDRPEGKELLARWGLPATLRGVGNCILGYPEGDVPTPKPRKPDYIVRV